MYILIKFITNDIGKNNTFSVPRLNFPEWDQTAHLDRHNNYNTIQTLESEPFDWLILSHELVIAPSQRHCTHCRFWTVKRERLKILHSYATEKLVHLLCFGNDRFVGQRAPWKGRCPDHCSGHGSCVIQNHKHSTRVGGKFMCECWPGFVG